MYIDSGLVFSTRTLRVGLVFSTRRVRVFMLQLLIFIIRIHVASDVFIVILF